MGLSSSSSSNTPWKGAQPYILGGANAIQGSYDKNADKIQGAADQYTSAFTPQTMSQAIGGIPSTNAAQSYNDNVLSGQYLNQGNPYLQKIIDQTNNDVMNQAEGSLGLHGQTGGSMMADIVSKNLAKNEANLRYGDYTNERNLMGQAAGQAPGLAYATSVPYSNVNSLMGMYNAPLNAANTYSSALGGLLGQYGTKTNTPSTMDQIGNGLSAAASVMSLFSDRRLKTDIRRVGQTDAGLPIYVFRYQGAGPVHMGVMADEVAGVQPQALGPEVSGYATVCYGDLR